SASSDRLLGSSLLLNRLLRRIHIELVRVRLLEMRPPFAERARGRIAVEHHRIDHAPAALIVPHQRHRMVSPEHFSPTCADISIHAETGLKTHDVSVEG